MTLDTIKQDIYFKAKITATTFQSVDLDRMVNEAYKRCQMLIRGVNENFFLVVATAPLQLDSTNSSAYSYPDDCQRVKQIQIAPLPLNTASPKPEEYQVVNFIDQAQITHPGTQFSQPHAVAMGKYFTLYPRFTDVTKYPVIKGIKVFYIRRSPDLVLPTDTPEFDDGYQDLISWMVTEQIAIRLDKMTLKAYAEAKVVERSSELKTYVSGREYDTQGLYLEGQSGRGGWDFPYGSNTY